MRKRRRRRACPTNRDVSLEATYFLPSACSLSRCDPRHDRSIAVHHYRLVRSKDCQQRPCRWLNPPVQVFLKPLHAAHPGMHTPARLFTDLTERVQKQRPIFLSRKSRLPPIAARHHMIVGTLVFNSLPVAVSLSKPVPSCCQELLTDCLVCFGLILSFASVWSV